MYNVAMITRGFDGVGVFRWGSEWSLIGMTSSVRSDSSSLLKACVVEVGRGQLAVFRSGWCCKLVLLTPGNWLGLHHANDIAKCSKG